LKIVDKTNWFIYKHFGILKFKNKKEMKNLLLMIVAVTMLFGCSTKTEEVKEAKLEKVLQIHQGSFAFCGASGAVPTGRKIIVVWSLFWYYDTTTKVPQFNPSTKGWEYMTPNNRAFIVNTDQPSTSEGNMFAMPGTIIDTLDNGIVLAKCYGPLNEAAVPLRIALPVESGMTSITAAKEGAPYPVGTPIPPHGSYLKK